MSQESSNSPPSSSPMEVTVHDVAQNSQLDLPALLRSINMAQPVLERALLPKLMDPFALSESMIGDLRNMVDCRTTGSTEGVHNQLSGFLSYLSHFYSLQGPIQTNEEASDNLDLPITTLNETHCKQNDTSIPTSSHSKPTYQMNGHIVPASRESQVIPEHRGSHKTANKSPQEACWKAREDHNKDKVTRPNSQWPTMGVPQPAAPTRFTAPVHVDVGGVLYTSSLQTLTKYPNSRLGQMFSGVIPIVLDTMKQHYFIDRDGALFRHVLNFLRTGQVNLKARFDEFDQLIQEAEHYGLEEMSEQLSQLRDSRPDLGQIDTDDPGPKSKKRKAEELVNGCQGFDNQPSNSIKGNERASRKPECIWLEMDEQEPYSAQLDYLSTSEVERENLTIKLFNLFDKEMTRQNSPIEGNICLTWSSLPSGKHLQLVQLLFANGYKLVLAQKIKRKNSKRFVHLLIR